MTSDLDEERDFCVECLSETSEKLTVIETISLPFSDPIEYEVEKLRCARCGQLQEETFANDEVRETAWEHARQSSLKNAIDELTSHGFSLTYCERVLDLPVRSLSQWRNSGKASHGAEALLRFLATCPWLVEVAAEKFTSEAAGRAVWKFMCGQVRVSKTTHHAAQWSQVERTSFSVANTEKSATNVVAQGNALIVVAGA